MTALSKGGFSQETEYTVSYSDMKGVDFSTPNSTGSRKRFSYLENIYKDYEGEGRELIESVPGFRRLFSLGKKINALYLQKLSDGNEFVVVHAGTSLYRFNVNVKDSPPLSLSPIASVEDTKSCAFSFGEKLYVLDGKKITVISPGGTTSTVSDNSVASAPYIPTSYINGTEYEQRNLLSLKFAEEFYAHTAADVSYATEGIIYKITDEENKHCAIVGIDEDFSGHLYVPSYTKIGKERYEVREVAENAFKNNLNLLSVNFAEGVTVIGSGAFHSCKDMMRAILPDSLKTIGDDAFHSCESLSNLRLGSGLDEIGAYAFDGCTSLTGVKYALSKDRFSTVKNSAALAALTLTEWVKNSNLRVRIPITTLCENLERVYLNGVSTEFAQEIVDGVVKSIILMNVDPTSFLGVTVRSVGYYHRTKISFNTPGTNFIASLGSGAEAINVIKECTVCECFDGRVFLSGNPKFPNSVFYSASDSSGTNNPLYFGVMNYFNDGVGGFPVISMLAAGDSLAVFKAGDDGGGSIFYHTPEETGISILPKIYPVSYAHCGISALGESVSFFDDPIFISTLGVCALDKKVINLERSVACRSHNVNPRLLSLDLKNASFAKWCGYLALVINGEMFLADSRAVFTHETGNYEYEWYYLNGIGSYIGDSGVYRYSHDKTAAGVEIHEKAGEIPEIMIYSSGTGADIYYYTSENGKKYAVVKTEERTGGTFSPAIRLLGVRNELLFFGTEGGDICVFNNDKRGVAPDKLSSMSDFDPEAYKKFMGRRIHTDFYSFAGHAPRYALSTVKDDCSISYMTKNTVKNSLTVKCKSFGKGSFICEAGTNGKGYTEVATIPDGTLDFSELDFERLAFFSESEFTIPISEKEKSWIEKQISVYTNEFASPFGIYSISYRFKIKGKIKKTKI